jgi:hypothetical protein
MFLGTLKGLLSCFKFEKNRLQYLGPKKRGVFSDVECTAKNSEACCDIALHNDGWCIVTNLQIYFFCSVGDSKPDPDQQDPHVFGPPAFGSESIKHRYGSGSLLFLIHVLK